MKIKREVQKETRKVMQWEEDTSTLYNSTADEYTRAYCRVIMKKGSQWNSDMIKNLACSKSVALTMLGLPARN